MYTIEVQADNGTFAALPETAADAQTARAMAQREANARYTATRYRLTGDSRTYTVTPSRSR